MTEDEAREGRRAGLSPRQLELLDVLLTNIGKPIVAIASITGRPARNLNHSRRVICSRLGWDHPIVYKISPCEAFRRSEQIADEIAERMTRCRCERCGLRGHTKNNCDLTIDRYAGSRKGESEGYFNARWI